MDRNLADDAHFVTVSNVALRKESVDRNKGINSSRTETAVALRKESVDRNHVADHFVTLSALSLSARRAWIEIVTLNQ